MIYEHITGICTRCIIFRSVTTPSFHILHVVHESLAVIVIIAAVITVNVGRIRSLRKVTRRRRSRPLRILAIFTPNAVLRANAELFHVSFRVGVVVLDQIAPGLLDGIVAGVLELTTPVGKPIADLRIG